MTAQAIQNECVYCPNPARVAAYTGAIAVHALAFAFLFLPITYEHVQKTIEPVFVWIDAPPKVEVPPIPPPPVRQQQTERRDKVKTHVDRVITSKPDTDFVEHVEPPAGPAIDQDIAIDPPAGPAVPAVADSMQLAILAAPMLYPPQLIRRGLEGTVLVRILVDREGKPAKIELGKSSGAPELDRAALSQVHRWRFQPMLKDGAAIEVWTTVPVKFTLERG